MPKLYFNQAHLALNIYSLVEYDDIVYLNLFGVEIALKQFSTLIYMGQKYQDVYYAE